MIPPLAGLILERVALATGFLAAAIAVGGLQRSAAIGGVCGLAFGLVIILLDAFLS
jgi:hypothetical protein